MAIVKNIYFIYSWYDCLKMNVKNNNNNVGLSGAPSISIVLNSEKFKS